MVNAAEHGSSLVISGTTTAPVGQTLTLTLNGKTYTTTVQTGGSWSYTLGSADVTALADGNAYVINASVSNAIGNTGSSNHTITVDLSAPAMGINIDSCKPTLALAPATLSPASARWWSTARSPPRLPVTRRRKSVSTAA
ncbi:hypothetical protein ECZU25_10590 [Escherichia coli]|nr:Ig-like domain-containing protein [Escherichia coli]GHK87502.1 hypothetical protein ECZU17_34390 [Escherichia coli]GHL19143.1 hypothetical protein ECZU24_19840 [Escherichia coli]GHL24246.1 hypothetical protein ECZU25_10590 [Escherichia coli]